MLIGSSLISLLIGSSLIRDVVSTKPDQLEVSCHRGGTVRDVTNDLSQRITKYDQVSILIGEMTVITKTPLLLLLLMIIKISSLKLNL